MLAGFVAAMLLAPPAAESRSWSPPAPGYGYSLDDTWGNLWRRMQDRHARGDEMGPLWQPRVDLDRREYPLTLAVADFPMRWERDWAQRDRGARFWMHSDDEFFFLNRVQIKERVPMGRVGAMGFRYDRFDGRTLRSSLLRLDFAFPDIRGSGTFVELRGYLRATKPDLDLQAALGQRFDWGTVTARAIVFDPITNASDALVQARNGSEPRRLRQRNLALGWTIEAQTKWLAGWRGEAYLGSVLPNRLRVEFNATGAMRPEELPSDFDKEQSAIVGGGMVEHALGGPQSRRPKAKPMHVGLATLLISTEHRVRFDEPERNGLPSGARLDAPERGTMVQGWWLAHLAPDLDAQVMVRWNQAWLGEAPGLGYPRVEGDRQWFAEARATWLFTRPFGVELGYSLLDRKVEAAAGDPDTEIYARYISGFDQRALLRFVLRFRHSFWASFGAGFDLDRGGEVYDQAGMTMMLRW